MNDNIPNDQQGTEKLRILILEDVPRDADLIQRELQRVGISGEYRVLDSREEFIRALDEFHPHIILSDYSMPQFNGLEALEIKKEHAPGLPFIVVTGSMNEEVAVTCMKAGADDYVLKEQLHQLPKVFEAALKKKRLEKVEIETREALKQSAREWDDTFDAVSDSIALLDSGRKVRRCNRAMQGLLNRSFREIVGLPLEELFGVSPIESERYPLQRAKISSHRESQAIEFQQRWFRVYVDPVLESEKTMGFVYIMHDITEHLLAETALRESEERFRLLVEQAPEAIAVFDVDKNRFIQVNAQAEKLFGCPREDLLKFGPQLFYGGPQSDGRPVADTMKENIAAILVGEERVIERAIHSLDGRELTCELRLGRLPDKNRKLLRNSFVDITDRKQAEKEREKLQAQLNQAQKMEAVGRLAGGVAHDFNNMLAVILGYAEMALDKVDPGQPVHADLEEIMNAARRSATIIRQLMAFSRKQVLSPEVLNLNEVVGNVEKMLRRLIGEDVDLIMDLAEDLGPVKADTGQLEQVLMNLAVNARDAMPGGGRLAIETRNLSLDPDSAVRHPGLDPGTYVLLTVSDTGTGMDRGTQSQVFEPFFTTKEQGRGTGLGLSTVYGIVKQSGGDIQVYSEPGLGATFKIYLPKVEEAKEERPELKPSKILLEGNETVLVVEDDEALRSLVREFLESVGYRVFTATDGEQGRILAEQLREPIHLLVTDVVMPKMNGLELAAQLVGLFPELKVLFMSGYADNALIKPDWLGQSHGFISKPFERATFLEQVRKMLD